MVSTYELKIGVTYLDRFENRYAIKDINNHWVVFTVTNRTDTGGTTRSEESENEETFARRIVARVG